MFINLNKKLERKKTNKKSFKRIITTFTIILIFLVIPLKFAFDGFKQSQANARALASAYSSQNFGQMVDKTSDVKNSLKKSDFALNFLIWLKIIPLLGGYYSDVKSLTSAGVDELEAMEILMKELKSKEKELGFTGQPLAGQDRISQAIMILEQIMPILPKVEKHFMEASKKVENIDTNKYPEKFRELNLRSSLQSAKNFIAGLNTAVNEQRDILEVTPSLLGGKTAKIYLLLFQNDKEIRATGGFLTAYATLNLDKGQITASNSDDIYRVDEKLLRVCLTKICPLSPPAPIVKYLPEVDGKPRTAWSMRDSNLSPDLPTTAKEFERMYTLLGEGLPFDGIIYIDTQVVEELIEITGPIDVYGVNYSAEKEEKCNCPKVIYGLESYAEIAEKGEQDRKAILGVLMSQMLAKLVGTDVEKIPMALETIVKLANHKHAMFYMHDEKVQNTFSKLNWTGQIKGFDGDYLHINDSNFAGGKSNLYVEQKVIQEIKNSGGKVTKKITIDYKNPQPFNTWLNGINRSYVRFYVPKGSQLISSKGSEDQVTTIVDELGKTVFEAFITVRPQNSRKLEIEYEIPYRSDGEYKLLIQKQSGAKDHHYIIKVNGSTKEDFKLDQDREFKFDI